MMFTSLNDVEEGLSDRIDVTITVHSVEEASGLVPIGQGRGLIVVGTQPIQHRFFGVIGSSLFNKVPAGTPFGRNRIERIVIHVAARSAR